MDWYKDDVRAAIEERSKLHYEPKTIFYGSSSIRLWNSLYEDFKEFKPVNLGFGGSTLAACVWFFERIIAPIRHPEIFILYAGDNDLGDGRSAEEVLIFFREFVVKLRKHYSAIPFYYISIKPSLSRLEIIDEIVLTNLLIEKEIANMGNNNHFVNIYSSMLNGNGKPSPEYFEDDGLHLNPAGYAVWKEIILSQIISNK